MVVCKLSGRSSRVRDRERALRLYSTFARTVLEATACPSNWRDVRLILRDDAVLVKAPYMSGIPVSRAISNFEQGMIADCEKKFGPIDLGLALPPAARSALCYYRQDISVWGVRCAWGVRTATRTPGGGEVVLVMDDDLGRRAREALVTWPRRDAVGELGEG